MEVQERIRMILLLEKIKSQSEYCDRIGIYDATTIGGIEINHGIPDDAVIISGEGR